jgi:hypothetical protein
MAAQPAQYPVLAWRKSRASAGDGECVEVAVEGSSVLIRDSRDNQGLVLVVEYGRWLEFVQRVRDGGLTGD